MCLQYGGAGLIATRAWALLLAQLTSRCNQVVTCASLLGFRRGGSQASEGVGGCASRGAA
jgi:hypothetical protein